MNITKSLKNFGIAASAMFIFLAIPPGSQGATFNVSVAANNTFAPASGGIAVNDTVLWTWPSGSFSHNVTSSSSPQAWTASSTVNGPANFSHTFTAAGSFPYVCTIHAGIGMVGSITVTNAVVANTPPTVSITSPATGTVLAAPGSVTIQATAADSDGSVTNVQFLLGTTVISNRTTAPFAATTNNLAAGSYNLSAVVSDNLGAKATNSISIIVDAPPSVTLTSPANGTVLSAPANVTFQATATDTDGTVTNVQFLLGATVVSNRPAAPFAATTNNLPTGSYNLNAIASDNNGIKATNSLAFTVVTPLPLTISAPQVAASSVQFSYAANIGLKYVVQKSTNLAASVWVPLSTNQAAVNPVVFADTHATNNAGFYRVGRLPNP